MAKGWQERLETILQRRSARAPADTESIEEARREIAHFFEETVMPAFLELKEELRRFGREVEIEKSSREAALIVYRDDDEEFSYGIRGHAYHTMSFAWPGIATGREPRVYSAEIVLGPGRRSEQYRLQEVTKEGIIEDFLDHYQEWLEH